MSKYGDRSEVLQRAKYNCCQSVLGSVCEDLGVDKELALQFSAEFGSGVAGLGGACGAVTGGLMAIGLWVGTQEKTDENKAKGHALAEEYIKRFKAQHAGLVDCCALLGADPGSVEGWDYIMSNNLHDTRCRQLIRDGAEIVSELLFGKTEEE